MPSGCLARNSTWSSASVTQADAAGRHRPRTATDTTPLKAGAGSSGTIVVTRAFDAAECRVAGQKWPALIEIVDATSRAAPGYGLAIRHRSIRQRIRVDLVRIGVPGLGVFVILTKLVVDALRASDENRRKTQRRSEDR